MALFIDGSEEKTSRWVRCVACLDTAFAFVEAAFEPTSYILPRLSVMQETFVLSFLFFLVQLLFVPLPKDGWFWFQNTLAQ